MHEVNSRHYLNVSARNIHITWLPSVTASIWKTFWHSGRRLMNSLMTSTATSFWCTGDRLIFTTQSFPPHDQHWPVLQIVMAPHGAGAPPFPLVPSLPHLLLLFTFFVGFNYFLLLSIPFLSTRIVSLRFQAGGRRKRPNLGLVCCVYFVLFVLSVFLS